MSDIELVVGPPASDVAIETAAPVVNVTETTVIVQISQGDIDGGTWSTNYGATGVVDGGTWDSTYDPEDTIDGGGW